MELVYLWVEDYKNIKKQGLTFRLGLGVYIFIISGRRVLYKGGC